MTLTAADVVLARRNFIDRYFQRGSGWFETLQATEDLFDALAEDEAFTDEYLIENAAQQRKVEDVTDEV